MAKTPIDILDSDVDLLFEFIQSCENVPITHSNRLSAYWYLVYADGDLEKAKVNFIATLNWFSEYKPFEKTLEDCQSLSTGKLFFHGVDKEGRPVLVFKPRFHDNSLPIEDGQNLFFLILIEALKRIPDGQFSVRLLSDMEGFGRKNVDNSYINWMLNTLQDHFPGRLETMNVINAGFFVKNIFKLFLVKLHVDFKKRVIFQDISELSEIITPDNLQTYYGGTSTFEFSGNPFA
eukprot:TRINITY_DN1797_c0_g1_i1.p1 TRINITY_DN1797_c0_g1~~TRINITY_DN1797_c0_g1_i1.p1  ORF type:complete len:246 (+),score=72.18 TRINITY_DN1797_c0_g1_i1:39-740(+)